MILIISVLPTSTVTPLMKMTKNTGRLRLSATQPAETSTTGTKIQGSLKLTIVSEMVVERDFTLIIQLINAFQIVRKLVENGLMKSIQILWSMLDFSRNN